MLVEHWSKKVSWVDMCLASRFQDWFFFFFGMGEITKQSAAPDEDDGHITM